MFPTQNFDIYMHPLEAKGRSLFKLTNKFKFLVEPQFSLQSKQIIMKSYKKLTNKQITRIIGDINFIDTYYIREYNNNNLSSEDIYINFYIRQIKWKSPKEYNFNKKNEFIKQAKLLWEKMNDEEKQKWEKERIENNLWWETAENFKHNNPYFFNPNSQENQEKKSNMNYNSLTPKEKAYIEIIKFFSPDKEKPLEAFLLFIEERLNVKNISENEAINLYFEDWVKAGKEEKKKYILEAEKKNYIYLYKVLTALPFFIDFLGDTNDYNDSITTKYKSIVEKGEIGGHSSFKNIYQNNPKCVVNENTFTTQTIITDYINSLKEKKKTKKKVIKSKIQNNSKKKTKSLEKKHSLSIDQENSDNFSEKRQPIIYIEKEEETEMLPIEIEKEETKLFDIVNFYPTQVASKKQIDKSVYVEDLELKNNNIENKEVSLKKPESPPSSGYLFFHKRKMALLIKQFPNEKHVTLTEMANKEWDLLDNSTKEKYNNYVKLLLENFRLKIEEFNRLGFYYKTKTLTFEEFMESETKKKVITISLSGKK